MIVTATRLETAGALLWARGAEVVHGGIALRRLNGRRLPPLVVSCGLAGALDADLRAGDVVIPDFVIDAGGRRFECDPELVDRLRRAAAELGHRPVAGGLLTSPRLVVGATRAAAAAGGLVAADMEAGLLAARCPRVAAVKVVLDSAADELSADWISPSRALRNSARWKELGRLAVSAPFLASRAGRVAARAVLASEDWRPARDSNSRPSA